MHWDDTLREDVVASQYKQLETRDEVISHYQKEYPGQKTLKNGQVRYDWKDKIVSDELALRPDAKRASIARRYQNDKKTGKDRYLSTKPSKSQQEEYKALGETLPPVPPETINYTVRVTGEIRISSSCRTVDFEITVGAPSDYSLQGQNAQDFTEEPNVEALVLAYWQGDDPGYAGWCSGPYYTIGG